MCKRRIGGEGRVWLAQGYCMIVSGGEVKEKIERGWCGRIREMGKGKLGFIEGNMTGNKHTVGRWVKTPIALVIRGIS